ncbi:MAG: glycine cleavage T C-terminal barrel domain-containing protein [Chloroherpetonaceae bacterium]|nr:hypothetical protein [Chthonomonadaceae bacterium]MDW8206880.1 glycine cleavage T C-terminal barrel domain-containing protein [Chloroherpetonaceae bacterium]
MDGEAYRQYRAVRDAAGWMQREGLGQLAIRGNDRYTWLQGMVSNDVRPLARGEVQRVQACVLDATGHVLTDLALLNGAGDPPWVLAEMPLQTLTSITAQFERYIIMEDVQLEDVTATVAGISLQGPQALDIWATFQEETESAQVVAWAGADHTGSGGVDLYVPVAEFEVWVRLLEARQVPRIDAEVQNVLRVEAGIPKYGAELDPRVIALEANIGPTHISLTKGCYVGQEIMARIDARGHTNRALTGLLIKSSTLPQPEDRLFFMEEGSERETGRITSVIACSPATQGLPVALGYVRHEHRTPGTLLEARNEERRVPVQVCTLPFYTRSL